MIQVIDHTKRVQAAQIHAIFQASYPIEAKLIGIPLSSFPPLLRSIEAIQTADTSFFGYWQEDELAAVIELITNPKQLYIRSLVVEPAFFRRGIGREILQFALQNFPAPVAFVETGAANDPAIALYEKLGFVFEKQWMTEVAIEKVRLKRLTV